MVQSACNNNVDSRGVQTGRPSNRPLQSQTNRQQNLWFYYVYAGRARAHEKPFNWTHMCDGGGGLALVGFAQSLESNVIYEACSLSLCLVFVCLISMHTRRRTKATDDAEFEMTKIRFWMHCGYFVHRIRSNSILVSQFRWAERKEMESRLCQKLSILRHVAVSQGQVTDTRQRNSYARRTRLLVITDLWCAFSYFIIFNVCWSSIWCDKLNQYTQTVDCL